MHETSLHADLRARAAVHLVHDTLVRVSNICGKITLAQSNNVRNFSIVNINKVTSPVISFMGLSTDIPWKKTKFFILMLILGLRNSLLSDCQSTVTFKLMSRFTKPPPAKGHEMTLNFHRKRRLYYRPNWIRTPNNGNQIGKYIYKCLPARKITSPSLTIDGYHCSAFALIWF